VNIDLLLSPGVQPYLPTLHMQQSLAHSLKLAEAARDTLSTHHATTSTGTYGTHALCRAVAGASHSACLHVQVPLSGQPTPQDTLLLVEHDPPVYTVGRQNTEEDFLVPIHTLEERGCQVVKTGRGGAGTLARALPLSLPSTHNLNQRCVCLQ
jgi:hypothetical protein